MIRKTAILVVALLAAFLCTASLSPVALAQCDRTVIVSNYCCYQEHAGWFYSVTGWEYTPNKPMALFDLSVDGVHHYGFCINYTVYIDKGNTFNASIYTATPTCKNNSIAYLLNNWIIDCTHCDNVSAGQSAVWYFTYINETFCGGGLPRYNNTATPADPEWESNWIPNCAVHPEACEFINESINKSVPYNITLTPSIGSFVEGAPVELEATVEYCLTTVGEEVTVVFETDNGVFENGLASFENDTAGGIARATLTCDAVGTAHVTARVKDMSWFRIIDPIGCQLTNYQPTLKIIDITDDAQFSFSEVLRKEVEGFVYEDWSCNCSYDQGEKGVPNVTVELVNVTTGLVVNTTMTDGSGYYNFTNVPVGTYTVRYDVSTLPPHLTPKCDDDSGQGSGIPAINTSNQFNGVGTHRHNFAVKAILGISIEKLVNGVNAYTAARNETVTFTLNVTNTGKANLTNLSVHDVFPLKQANKGLTWTGWAEPFGLPASSINPDGWIHFTLDWPDLTQFEPLEPGESFVITFNATVDSEAEGMYCDVAYVTAKGEGWCLSVTDNDDACVFVETEKKVPVLTPLGIAALIGLLSLVTALSIKRRRG